MVSELRLIVRFEILLDEKKIKKNEVQVSRNTSRKFKKFNGYEISTRPLWEERYGSQIEGFKFINEKKMKIFNDI